MTPTTSNAAVHRARLARAVTTALIVLTSGTAHAAFFQLAENSPAGLGNANAGGAAVADDASTVWYNPAGLTRLQGQELVLGGHFIAPSFKASRVSASTVAFPAVPFPPPYAAGSSTINGGNGGDAGESALVPNFYYAHQYNDRLHFGLGVNAPFGLATDYANDWAGRYHADRSEIMTVNINPTLAYKVNEAFSLGAGINYQQLEATLTQAVDFGSICAAVALQASNPALLCGAQGSQASSGKAKVEADDDAWGYNFGFLWNLNSSTRFGLHYRSKLEYELEGDFDITRPSGVTVSPVVTGATGLVDSNAKADVTLPAMLSLSAFAQLNPTWAVMGDITRTYWGDLPELRIEFDSTQNDSIVTLDLKDVNRYSVGATYTPGGAWMYRAGIALDKTPTPNATARTPRLPDEDRLWLSLGAGYKSSDKLQFDFAYTYIMVDDAKVEKTAGPLTAQDENTFRGNLTANYEGSTHVLSAQARWRF